MKRELPLLITGLMGTFLILQVFVPHPPLDSIDETLTDFALIVIVFTMILGIINLIATNLRKITRSKPGWGYAAITIGAFLVVAGTGMFNLFEERSLKKEIARRNSDLVELVVAIEASQMIADPSRESYELLVQSVVKSLSDSYSMDARILQESGVDPREARHLLERGMPDKARFEAVFSPAGINYEGFQILRERTQTRIGQVADYAVPYGKALLSMVETVQEFLAEWPEWHSELLALESNGGVIPPERYDFVLREARQRISPGDFDVMGRTVPMGAKLGSQVCKSVIERIKTEMVALEEDALRRDPDARLTEDDARAATLARNVPSEVLADPAMVLALADFVSKDAPLEGLDNTRKMSWFATFYLDPILELDATEQGSAFNWLYEYVYYPLSSTMFALLAFFISSAAYRAFRARSREAAMLLLAGTIVMLGMIPLGNLLTSWLPEWLQMSDVADWIMMVPNMASQRAIMIGVALGVISTALKLILGVERGYLGGD